MNLTKILLPIFFLLPYLLFSQTEKISLAVTPFAYSNSEYQQVADEVTRIFTDEFARTNRFTLVDRSSMDIIIEEKKLQRSVDFVESDVVDIGKNVGAQFIATGYITSISQCKYKTYKRDDGSTYRLYYQSIGLSIKVINVETGEIEAQKGISSRNKGGSCEEALGNAMHGRKSMYGALTVGGISNDIKKFIGEHFPIEVKIQKIVELDRRGEAKEVLLLGGSEIGLKKGERIEVKESVKLDLGNGQVVTRKKTIGTLKVIDVEDEFFSKAKVRDGGDVILNKFNAGEVLKGYTYNIK